MTILKEKLLQLIGITMKLIACRLLQIKIAIDHLERAGRVRYLSNPIVMQITFVRGWNFLCMFVFCKISTHILPYRQYLILLRNILDWMGPYSSIRNFFHIELNIFRALQKCAIHHKSSFFRIELEIDSKQSSKKLCTDM